MPSDIQNTELNMTKYFNDFCKKNNLNFFLDSGTLLGAVRHKGFIPWDDDMDLILFRSDYEKLKQLANEFENENYKLLFIENTADYYYPYVKMVDKNTRVVEKNKKEIEEMGIFIDVFPLDLIPDNLILKRIYFAGVSVFRRLFFIFYKKKSESDNLFKKLIVKLLPMSFTRRWSIWFNAYGSIFHNETDAEFCSHILGNLKNTTVPVSYHRETVMLPFEDTEFPVPVEYDQYLKDSFGDYMKLPPESERKTHGLNVKKR